MTESNATAPNSQAPLWTARMQHLSSTVKPVRLVEVGTGPNGKFARIEFADEVTRPVYLETMADAWHPLFDSLTTAERWAIREYFSPFDPEQLADGNVKTKFILSFVTQIKKKNGRFVSRNNFDVPAQSYGDGELTGIRAAQEYMAAISLPNFACADLNRIVSDMATCLVEDSEKGIGAPKRSNIAVSFLRELEAMLRFAAKNCNHQKYFEQRVSQREQYAQEVREAKQAEKSEFSARMRQAREAKRQGAPNTRNACSASAKEVSMSI